MTGNKLKNGGYTFSDLAIIPRIPKEHHNAIQTGVQLTPELILSKPFISSPMDTVTNSTSAIKLALNGAMGILHYNYKESSQLLEEIKKIKRYAVPKESVSDFTNGTLPVGVLVKCEIENLNYINELISLGINFIAIDSLHTSPHMHIPMVKKLKKEFPKLPILSGNVVHPEDCLQLIDAGVTMLRIGYSAASINDGKNMFGTGRSQANAIYECAKVAKKHSIPLIADGGLKNSGDIALAFALGADCVMLGRMFAASYDTPGTIICDENGNKKKIYKGMSRKGLIDKDLLAEGKEVKLDANKSIIDIVNNLDLHLRMSISRAGAVSLKDFYENSEVQLLTQQAIRELCVE